MALTVAAILVSFGAPYALDWLPRAMPVEEKPCDEAPDRCAGLWSATCCDYSTPRTRFAFAGDVSASPGQYLPPACLAPQTHVATAGFQGPAPPGGEIADLRREHELSSTVLRL